MNITFTDGVKFNTDCKPQIVRKSDGLYVIGNGILIPVNSIKEAKEVLRALNKTLGLKLDLNKLDTDIKEIEKDIKSKSREFNKLSKNIQKANISDDISYIG